MRLISIGILLNQTIFDSHSALNELQDHFSQSITHNYLTRNAPGSDVVLLFWEKLYVDDTFNTADLKLDLESKIAGSQVFINELMPIEGKFAKHRNTIIAAIIGLATTLGSRWLFNGADP